MSLPSAVRAVDRVLVALEPDDGTVGPDPVDLRTGTIHSGERTVMAAEVLASWFGASLQFVTTDSATAAERLEQLSGTIGLRTDPVVVVPADTFARDLGRHASACAPSLVVTTATPAGLATAASAPQPTYLIPPGPKRRQPSGPLVVSCPDGAVLDEALALATVWALALATPLELLLPAPGTTAPDGYEPDRAAVGQTRARLEAMGIRVTLREGIAPDEVFTGDGVMPLALVVPAAGLGSEVVARVLAAGGGVLVAPTGDGTTTRRPTVDVSAVEDLAAALGDATPGPDAGADGGQDPDGEALSAEACAEILATAPVGRLAYVDHGWPVVVPVNFAVHGGDIFIRSVRGGKLEAAARHDRVCFEADTVSAPERRGASVLVHGHLEVIADPATLQAAWANDPSPWIDDTRYRWLRLVALATTGRQVG